MAGGGGGPTSFVNAMMTAGNGGAPTPTNAPKPVSPNTAEMAPYYPSNFSSYTDYSQYQLPNKESLSPTSRFAYDMRGLNPTDYGRFSQTPDMGSTFGYGQDTLVNYLNNLPSYQQPGGTGGGGGQAFASNLAAQTQAQAGAIENQLKAAEQERVRQSAEALKAYQVQKAKDEAAAAERARQASLAAIFSRPGRFGFFGGGGGEAAQGGLASLKGFDK